MLGNKINGTPVEKSSKCRVLMDESLMGEIYPLSPETNEIKEQQEYSPVAVFASFVFSVSEC